MQAYGFKQAGKPPSKNCLNTYNYQNVQVLVFSQVMKGSIEKQSTAEDLSILVNFFELPEKDVIAAPQ